MSIEQQATVPDLVACPFCAEQILRAAKKCKHCSEILDVTMRARANASGAAASASSSSTTVVIRDRSRFNHGLHILLSVITLGAWLPLYLIFYLVHIATRD